MDSSESRAPSRTRIYWLTEEFYPPQIGGLELMVSRLSQGLAECGFDVRVITRQPSPPCAPHERIGDVAVRRIRPGGTFKGSGWRALPLIVAYLVRLTFLLLLEATRYDVLLVSGMKVMPLVAVPLSRLLRKRCIVRLESTSELDEPVTAQSLTAMGMRTGRLLNRVLSRVQLRVVSRADRVVSPSRQLAADLSACGVPPGIVREIPNAIDLRKFHAAPPEERRRLREKLALPLGATLLVFVGRLSRAKGVELLVDAWPEIASRHPDLCLVIVGKGGESFDDCEQDVRDSIGRSGLGPERVRMMGARDNVHEFLQAADLYVLPSWYEGFSVGLIEALATGLPVLVTPVGGAPQLIRDGENGFLFPAGQRDAMIAAIGAALEARSRWPQIGASARSAVASMDLANVIRQYAALIEQLLPFPEPGKSKSGP